MAKTPPVVYIFHGNDEHAMAESLAQMHASMGEPSLADLNTTRLQGRGLSLADLEAACLATPFAVRRRLVIVEGYLAARSSAATEEQDESGPLEEGQNLARADSEELLALLGAVPDSTALVFLERRELPAKHPLLRWAASQGGRVLVKQFDLPKGASLTSWIEERARAEDGRFSPQAAQLLASLVGDDPRRLDQEVRKLVAYVGYSRPVTPQDVRAVTPESAQISIFEMVDAIGERRPEDALRLLHKLLQQEDFGFVWGMIIRQFRLLILAREALEARTPPEALASLLHVHPFVARKTAAQAQRFSLPDLERIYRNLLAVDEAIKTGRTEVETALALLVSDPTEWRLAPGPST